MTMQINPLEDIPVDIIGQNIRKLIMKYSTVEINPFRFYSCEPSFGLLLLVILRLSLVEIQTIFFFIYVCVLGQCTRHFKQVLHPCMLTISSLETDLLQTLPFKDFSRRY